MILKKKISKKYFRQLYRALFLVVFVVSGNLFQIEMGIIQKVLNLEIYIKWSPLAIAVLFKMKKKKEKSEQNCGAEVRARSVTDEHFFKIWINTSNAITFSELIASCYRRRLQNGTGCARLRKKCVTKMRNLQQSTFREFVYFLMIQLRYTSLLNVIVLRLKHWSLNFRFIFTPKNTKCW